MDEKKAHERREQRLAREKELYAGEVTLKYLYNPAQGVWPGRITVHGIQHPHSDHPYFLQLLNAVYSFQLNQ